MSTNPDLMKYLFAHALGRKASDVKRFSTVNLIDKCIEKQWDGIEVLWLDRVPEGIYQFWRLVRENCLAVKAHVVISLRSDDVNPMCRDLVKAYKACVWGSCIFLVYTYSPNPGVYPSQKGLFFGREER